MSNYYGDPPPGQSQLPQRWATLPSIPGKSPIPHSDNQLVPYNANNIPNGVHDGSGVEFRQLEMRINVAERSNRALLEEVVRLQSEVKGQTRQAEEKILDERNARKQMENSLRTSNDLIAQLTSRLQRAEDRVQEEQQTLSALVSHSKSVEEAVVGSQKEMLSRRDLQGARLQDVQSKLEDATRSRDQLERVTFQVVDEMRQMKARMDTQGIEFSQVISDLRNKSRRLEDENRQTLDSMRKVGENHSQTEQSTSQLRNQVESRLAELRDVLVELRGRQDTETQERRMLDQQMQIKIGDVASQIAEQNRRREEALHSMENLVRDKDHAGETEKIRVQSRIAEIAEDVSKKIMSKEIKLREEMQQRYSQVEQLVRGEQDTRQKFERDMRQVAEERMEAMTKMHSDELNSLRESQRGERRKQNETLQTMNKSVDLLEKQIEEQRKKQDKLIAAEVSARMAASKSVNENIENLHEKVNVATSTMQQAIGGLTLQLTTQQDKLKQDMRDIVEQGQGSHTRALADMDARIVALNQKIGQTEDILEAKIQAAVRKSQINPETKELEEASAVQSQNIREKIESIGLWQEVTSQTLRELQGNNQKSMEEFYQMRERNQLLKSEIDSKMRAEQESRERETEQLRKELEELIAKGGGKAPQQESQPKVDLDHLAKQEDVDAIQQSIRKLAESIQTVKTVLGMKIQSEQKLREKDLLDLKKKQEKMKRRVDRLDNTNNANNNNGDDEDDDDEDDDDDDKEDDKDGDKKDDKDEGAK